VQALHPSSRSPNAATFHQTSLFPGNARSLIQPRHTKCVQAHHKACRGLRRTSTKEVSAVGSHSERFHLIDSRSPIDEVDLDSIDLLEEEFDSLLEVAVVLPKHPYQVERSKVCALLLLLPVVHSTLDQEEVPEIVVVSKFHRQQIRLVFDTFQLMRFRNRIEIE